MCRSIYIRCPILMNKSGSVCNCIIANAYSVSVNVWLWSAPYRTLHSRQWAWNLNLDPLPRGRAATTRTRRPPATVTAHLKRQSSLSQRQRCVAARALFSSTSCRCATGARWTTRRPWTGTTRRSRLKRTARRRSSTSSSCWAASSSAPTTSSSISAPVRSLPISAHFPSHPISSPVPSAFIFTLHRIQSKARPRLSFPLLSEGRSFALPLLCFTSLSPCLFYKSRMCFFTRFSRAPDFTLFSVLLIVDAALWEFPAAFEAARAVRSRIRRGRRWRLVLVA